MLQVTNVSLQYGSKKLFEDVNLKFTKGNCYGIIGANGAGKSTFLKILSGEIEPNKGEVSLDKTERMSVLQQNQNAFDNVTVLRAVMLGHKKLVRIMDEKDALYSKADFTEEDGVRASELEAEFAELGGWDAEYEAQTLLNELDIGEEYHNKLMADLDAKQKVKVLLAQALFGNPDVLILDEPTNNLDIKTVRWLENYLLDFENTIIIVSHNRHFLNKVCTYICDVDYGKINMMLGNYDFWYQTSQLLARQQRDLNKKNEQRAKELQEFIARFAANASKSRQATSRKKELEKLTISDFKPSLRKYPYIDFKYEKELGNDILMVENLTKKGYFENVSFTVQRDDKIGIVSDKSTTISMLYDILMGKVQPDEGTVKWGKTVTASYFPENNNEYFQNCELTLVQWLSQFSKDHYEEYLRGWLGRMLFSGEEALKQAKVLSGGEKVRCMLAKMMLEGGNFLIFDEPTNHLDLESITALNNGMKNFKGCMLFTSHDQELMNTVGNRIIEINGTKTFDKKLTYDEYIDLITQ
ncbi:MAG TPA: ATP-binding cassette domain-containing protein [Candidatus Coproplasma excrementigallinarum]|uniref:ATP-binding cassette domain-containing protein n=1 Tax=Candidatus Coproplasma excrementigallinarum TaxID=2840747 RepID=A0A9D1SJA6_9FIRM|nr:ATP-binding cassette domain-containing protein [Candidatus Coproplasma excrementigallinarum]